MLNYKEAL